MSGRPRGAAARTQRNPDVVRIGVGSSHRTKSTCLNAFTYTRVVTPPPNRPCPCQPPLTTMPTRSILRTPRPTAPCRARAAVCTATVSTSPVGRRRQRSSRWDDTSRRTVEENRSPALALRADGGCRLTIPDAEPRRVKFTLDTTLLRCSTWRAWKPRSVCRSPRPCSPLAELRQSSASTTSSRCGANQALNGNRFAAVSLLRRRTCCVARRPAPSTRLDRHLQGHRRESDLTPLTTWHSSTC